MKKPGPGQYNPFKTSLTNIMYSMGSSGRNIANLDLSRRTLEGKKEKTSRYLTTLSDENDSPSPTVTEPGRLYSCINS
jgi:hypothetical protein